MKEDVREKRIIRDGMIIEIDVPVPMDDGIVLRADVFRPEDGAPRPVLISYGPYGKGLPFQEGYKTAWEIMAREHPDAVAGTSNAYANWEVLDPEKWVPEGYVVVRVDSRGAGRSPGYLDHHSPRETRDFYECIEWAGVQPWSTGKVGLAGVSYYATNQWRVAAMKPPHLAAICVWEGYSDRYRDATHHGGIACTFQKNWQDMQVKTVQHGRGDNGPRSPLTGDTVCGPPTLSDEDLTANRSKLWPDIIGRPFDEDFYRVRSADWSKIETPLLSSGNWGGQGLHLRGNVEGFVNAASEHKWLEMHGGSHWAIFYTDYGTYLQKRFFDHFLHGRRNGWDKQPPIQLQIRHPGEKFVLRHETEWPIARTQWTKAYLGADGRLGPDVAAGDWKLDFDATGDGLTFMSEPLAEAMEITGPMAAKLFVSSSTTDADLFLVFRVFDPAGREVVFQGALDPHTPVAQGWLRMSHRATDPAKSLPWRPWHPHDRTEPLEAGRAHEADVEIWPTCIVIPAGYRYALTVRGRDYEYDGPAAALSNMKNPMKGCGPFVHDDEQDRPPEIFGGTTTLHGKDRPHVLLPVIPKR
jgi:predicted acyl esterase